LAVVDDVEAGLDLPLHDVDGRSLKSARVPRLLRRMLFRLGGDFQELRRANETSDMRGEDAIVARHGRETYGRRRLLSRNMFTNSQPQAATQLANDEGKRYSRRGLRRS